jgi:peptide/nickel transport system ATP-binding protein
MSEPLLAIDRIRVAFHGGRGKREVLSGVSLEVGVGEIVGVVGESGSGKSVTALAIMRLLGEQGEITAGSIRLDGTDLTTLGETAMRDLRGRHIAMIFQEPMTSLNPLLTVGVQIGEVLREKLGLSRSAARERAVALLGRVGIPNPPARYFDYPNTLSGGMRQRVMIAMALACAPRLLLADEPTTALDVTIQAQILDLMATLRSEEGAAILLITHDMGVIARMAERVVVMYAGEGVETAPIAPVFTQPAHR